MQVMNNINYEVGCCGVQCSVVLYSVVLCSVVQGTAPLATEGGRAGCWSVV